MFTMKSDDWLSIVIDETGGKKAIKRFVKIIASQLQRYCFTKFFCMRL